MADWGDEEDWGLDDAIDEEEFYRRQGLLTADEEEFYARQEAAVPTIDTAATDSLDPEARAREEEERLSTARERVQDLEPPPLEHEAEEEVAGLSLLAEAERAADEDFFADEAERVRTAEEKARRAELIRQEHEALEAEREFERLLDVAGRRGDSKVGKKAAAKAKAARASSARGAHGTSGAGPSAAELLEAEAEAEDAKAAAAAAASPPPVSEEEAIRLEAAKAEKAKRAKEKAAKKAKAEQEAAARAAQLAEVEARRLSTVRRLAKGIDGKSSGWIASSGGPKTWEKLATARPAKTVRVPSRPPSPTARSSRVTRPKSVWDMPGLRVD